MIGLKMDMPQGCEKCPCGHDGFCDALYFIKNEVSSLPEDCAYSETKRYDECPLVEIVEEKSVFKKLFDRILRHKKRSV